MSTHIPERLEGESFTTYKARRAHSHSLNRAPLPLWPQDGSHAQRAMCRREIKAAGGIRQFKKQRRQAA